MATDGHTMARATNCGRTDGKSYTVPRAALEQALPLLRKNTDVLHVHIDDVGMVTLAAIRDGEGLGVVHTTSVSAVFPPYEAVIPRYDGDAAAIGRTGFNPEYLGRVALIARACQREYVEWRLPPAALDPLLALVSDPQDATDWTAVIMPCRV